MSGAWAGVARNDLAGVNSQRLPADESTAERRTGARRSLNGDGVALGGRNPSG